ncbi:hypothetical protein FN846DRAFT_952794, partial [Sphaerosporella brunnea]
MMTTHNAFFLFFFLLRFWFFCYLGRKGYRGCTIASACMHGGMYIYLHYVGTAGG